MDGVAEQIIKVLNIEQNQEDEEDVNTPLKPSKQSSSRKGRRKGTVSSYLSGTPLTVCLVLFSVLFVGSMLYGATFSTAETAWLSNGFNGVYTSDDDGHAVVRNLHKQESDWGKTQHAASAAGGSAALAAKVKMLEGELAKEKTQDARTHRSDGWGKQDYVKQVQAKEKKEEAKIQAQVAKDDEDRLHADTVGLDRKHRQILRQMKRRMHDRNSLARVQAQQDYNRREKEINALMPSDDNCPGVHCLQGSAAVRPQHRLFQEVHAHPPWHKHYPSEMSNVLASHRGGDKTPWVKVSGGQTDYARHKAEVNTILPPAPTVTHKSRR